VLLVNKLSDMAGVFAVIFLFYLLISTNFDTRTSFNVPVIKNDCLAEEK